MKYIKPNCEYLAFDEYDVIATSTDVTQPTNQTPSLEDNNNFDAGDGYNY